MTNHPPSPDTDNPVEVSNKHLSLPVGRYVPTKVIRVHNDKLYFDHKCRHALTTRRRPIIDRPVIGLWLTVKSLSAVT